MCTLGPATKGLVTARFYAIAPDRRAGDTPVPVE
jgi:hypothetical protein